MNKRIVLANIVSFTILLNLSSPVLTADLGSIVSKKNTNGPVEHSDSADYSRDNMNVKDVKDPVLEWGAKVGREMLEGMANADPADGSNSPVSDGSCQRHVYITIYLHGYSATDIVVAARGMPERVSSYSSENDGKTGNISYQSYGDFCVAGRYQVDVAGRPSLNAAMQFFSVGFNVPMGAKFCSVTVDASLRSILSTYCQ